MAEETSAVDQPSSAATEAPSSEPYIPSFLRDDPEPESDAADTSQTQTADDEGEAPPEEETASAEAEQQPEEGDSATESQDDFLASLTPGEHAYYAKRYPTLYKAYQDPNQPDDLRQALIDRVNQDHAYAELRDGQQPEEEPEEPTQEAPPLEASEQRKQYYAQIDDVVTNHLDQQMVTDFGQRLLVAMGVDPKSQEPEVKAIVQNSGKIGQELARGALDLMQTLIPQLLPKFMEASGYKKFDKMYWRATYADAWEATRNKAISGPDGKSSTPYAKLPAYGSEPFRAALDKAMNEIPGLEEMVYRDRYGNVLDPEEQAMRKYALVAKMMTGQQINPAAMAQAVETGKKLARSADTRRAAGKVLGAGKTTGDVKPGGSSNDDIFGPGVEEYRRRGG